MPVPRLACLLALLLAVPVASAPAPVEPDDPVSWQRLLPEDTDGLLVLDYKAFLDSPLVKKGLKGKLPPVLADRFVWVFDLKALGIDPPKDLRRVILATARSYWAAAGEGPDPSKGGVVILFETGKGSEALRDKLDALAKDGDKGVKAVADAKVRLYEVKLASGVPFVVTVLPGGTLAVSPSKDVLLAALALSRKPKKPLKSEAMAKFVKGLKPGVLLAGRMMSEAALNVSVSNVAGAAKPTVKLHTLAESGVEGVTMQWTVKDVVAGSVDVVFKDAEKAAQVAKQAAGFVAMVQLNVPPGAGGKAAAKFIGTIKAIAEGKSVIFKGEADSDAIAALELIPLK